MLVWVGNCQAVRVEKIHVDGLQRVERETILSYLSVKVREEFSQEDIDSSLKSLFNTGLFSDVRLRVQGQELYIKVVERPIISRIAFEGNDKISDKTLKEIIKDRIAVRQVLNRALAQEISKDIQQAYQARGHFSAAVIPQIIRRPENRVDLIFSIIEGLPATIKRIVFAGNEHFSTDALIDEIATKEDRWWRFWGYDDIYTPERLEIDRRMLRKFYQKNGYADFKVLSSVAELSIDRKDFFVTFVVEEGIRYTVKSASLRSDIQGLSSMDLISCIALEQGDVLDATLIEKTVGAIEEKVGTQGYAFAVVEPKITFHRQEKTADVLFIIQRGPKNFVQRIEIEGNSRTLDSVIRREVQLHEGDPLNATKMKKSIQRIRDLGFFEDVRVGVDSGIQPNAQVIKIEVDERSTGQFKFGVGFSTGDGFTVMCGYEEKNFLGGGKAIDLNISYAPRYHNVYFDICEPFFLNRPLLAGIALSTYKRDRSRASGYKGTSHAMDIYMGYALSENLWHRVGYKISLDDIESHGDDKSLSYVEKEQFGQSVCSQIHSSLIYSALDSRHDPKKGYNCFLKQSVAGIGGSVAFLRNELGGSYYYHLGENWVLVSRLRGGVIFKGRLLDRFSLGGDTFRGFETDGLGPRERRTEKAVYGQRYYFGTFLVRIPFGSALGLRGVTFVEYGNVWGTRFSKEEVHDSRKMRVSGGVGIEWFSPFGPIGVSISRAFVKEPYDKTQSIQLTGLVP
jgi:outer membrane protein insertion porin family